MADTEEMLRAMRRRAEIMALLPEARARVIAAARLVDDPPPELIEAFDYIDPLVQEFNDLLDVLE